MNESSPTLSKYVTEPSAKTITLGTLRLREFSAYYISDMVNIPRAAFVIHNKNIF